MNTYQIAALALRIKALDREVRSMDLLIKQHLQSVDVTTQKRDSMAAEIDKLREGVELREGVKKRVRSA